MPYLLAASIRHAHGVQKEVAPAVAPVFKPERDEAALRNPARTVHFARVLGPGVVVERDTRLRDKDLVASGSADLGRAASVEA